MTPRYDLPYGIKDIKQVGPKRDSTHTECYIKGCGHSLEMPRRGFKGSTCPDHGIRCHKSFTYSYADARRNVICDRWEFKNKLLKHPFKFESHRMGLERSEDTLSWNVFKAIQSHGLLKEFTEHLTNRKVDEEPQLFLWGISMETYEAWDMLIAARNRFESNLPVDRPLTEPDIAIHVPGQIVILIEAKFTSANPVYKRGPRANAQSLTLDELTGIYQDRMLRTLNLSKAENSNRIHYQLWRNMIFAEWMAGLNGSRVEHRVVNLVRDRSEKQSVEEFRQLFNSGCEDAIQRLTWESIYSWAKQQPRLDILSRYMEQKTAGLKPAFDLPRPQVET